MPTANRVKQKKIGEVERVYGILRDWLITGKLGPGEFLFEGDIAAECGTSRTPVREACTRLMQDRWLSRIPQKGFLVTPISVRDIAGLYEYRKVLECFAAEKVARTAGEEQIAELCDIVAPENSLEKNTDILRVNEAFHLRLSQLAGNKRVVNQLELTFAFVSRLDRLCTKLVPGWIRTPLVPYGHAEILSLIKEHQADAARKAMEVHIDASRDKMIDWFSK